MLYAKADQRVLGYLGRALSLELTAVQQYSTQARLVAAWGLTEAAEKLGHEATEEMEHADRIIGRMLALGVAPNASQLRPAMLGRNLYEVLVNNHAFEQELVRLYTDATRHCAAKGDHDSRIFFEALLKEEMQHAEELSRWIQTLSEPGHVPVARDTNTGVTF
ncbi:MAG: bacterioferritin [Gammaproteobacteria bacterium]|nr:bacterioferritin [Gammaproteobacteria bacterium]